MSNEILSQNRNIFWIFVGIGLLMILITIPPVLDIPKESARGNQGIWLVLAFPLMGLYIIGLGLKQRKNYLRFGQTPLTMNPEQGQVGGQLGASIRLNSSKRDISVKASLSCVRVDSSRNSSSSESILWQVERKPYIKDLVGGSEIRLIFDLPEDQVPSSGMQSKRKNVYWKISLHGLVDGDTFDRFWKVPVVDGKKHSSLFIPDEHFEAENEEKVENANRSAVEQIQINKEDKASSFISDSGRNSEMSGGFTLFGGIFTLVGCGLFYGAYSGQAPLWFFAPVFFSIGLSIFLLGLYLKGRQLDCKIDDRTIFTCRTIFGKLWKTHYVDLEHVKNLELKRTMSSQSGGKLTEFFGIYANVFYPDGKYKQIKLVEGLKGRDVAEVMLSNIEKAVGLKPADTSES